MLDYLRCTCDTRERDFRSARRTALSTVGLVLQTLDNASFAEIMIAWKLLWFVERTVTDRAHQVVINTSDVDKRSRVELILRKGPWPRRPCPSNTLPPSATRMQRMLICRIHDLTCCHCCVSEAFLRVERARQADCKAGSIVLIRHGCCCRISR